MKSLQLLILAFCFSSCGMLGSQPKGMVAVADIEGGFKAMQVRHDAYVRADTKLDPVEKQIYLDTSAILIQLLETAK